MRLIEICTLKNMSASMNTRVMLSEAIDPLSIQIVVLCVKENYYMYT